jgi:hypothetical protein
LNAAIDNQELLLYIAALLPMNSYFKTADEIAVLFQEAINTLHRQGYEVARELLEEALRFDPFHWQAHFELSIYHASVKNLYFFRYHFFICWNLDPSCKESILNHEIVLNALSREEIAETISLKEKEWYLPRGFIPIDTTDDPVYLRFNSSYKKEIATLYNAYHFGDDDCFIIEKSHFRLEYNKERDTVRQPTEVVYARLQQLSTYLQDVRFLIGCAWDDYLDEVIIQKGTFHIYRHRIGNDTYHSRMEYLESIVDSYPDDAALRAWLCTQYLGNALDQLETHTTGFESQYLAKAISLSENEDPRIDYLLGKLNLKKDEKETALGHFRKTTAKMELVFELYYDLGKVQALYSTQYKECIDNLSRALALSRADGGNLPEVYIHRALAYYKWEKEAAGEAEIALYINAPKEIIDHYLLTWGKVFFNAGLHKPAKYLFSTALEKNGLHESELIKQRNSVSDDRKDSYDRPLKFNADTRAEIYICLSKLNDRSMD